MTDQEIDKMVEDFLDEIEASIKLLFRQVIFWQVIVLLLTL